jgi:hypothetical protein
MARDKLSAGPEPRAAAALEMHATILYFAVL